MNDLLRGRFQLARKASYRPSQAFDACGAIARGGGVTDFDRFRARACNGANGFQPLGKLALLRGWWPALRMSRRQTSTATGEHFARSRLMTTGGGEVSAGGATIGQPAFRRRPPPSAYG